MLCLAVAAAAGVVITVTVAVCLSLSTFLPSLLSSLLGNEIEMTDRLRISRFCA